MLSEQDLTKIRNVQAELDQDRENLNAAIRETEHAKDRLRQVKAEIRPAARTRFTTWLTNSDPEEHRRYRAAIAKQKAQRQLVRDLEPRVAAGDARIDAAVAACLARSDEAYQDIMARRSRTDADLETCERLRARAADLRGEVNAALAQLEHLRDRDPKEVRKALDPATAQLIAAANTLRSELTALAPRMRPYGSFPTRKAQKLRAEFSGRRADSQTRRAELMNTRAAVGSVHAALTSACSDIAKHRKDLDRQRDAMVRAARAEALGH